MFGHPVSGTRRGAWFVSAPEVPTFGWFEIAVAVAEETRPWEGRVFSVCVVGLVNEGMATIHKNLPSAPISELSAWLPDQWKLRQSTRTLTL
jgi:hypothetical protein